MCTNLKAGGEIRSLIENYEKNRMSKDCEAVMDLITRANREQMEEEKSLQRGFLPLTRRGCRRKR